MAIVAALLLAVKQKFTENLEEADVSLSEEYSALPEDEALFIMEKDTDPVRCIIRDGEPYLPFDFVTSVFNDGFFWDEDENICFYVLPEAIMKFYAGGKNYHYNGALSSEEVAPVIVENGERFMSMHFCEKYSDVKFSYYEDPARIVANHGSNEYLFYRTVDDAPLHIGPDIKSGVLLTLSADSEIYYISGNAKSSRDFLKVMTADGIFGYVQKKHVGESYYDLRSVAKKKLNGFYCMYDGTVKLGWHLVASEAGNVTYDDVVKRAEGMNVISPTWLKLSSEDGDITSIGSAEYVEKAHEAGLKVWILIDNFDDEVSSHETLANTDSREKLEANLVAETQRLGADGINIDFEALAQKTGIYFVEFLKELSVRCHFAGLTLSVDDYVPSAYRSYYDLETQGKYVDYVILMAYDEHYAGSPTAGSVSSIGYVRDAITNCLEMVNKEHIMVGLPFYTRLWRENAAGVSSEAMTMRNQMDYISENNIELTWDEETAQNYAEFKVGGVVHKMWVEDSRSLSYKLSAAANADIGGVAFWRLGQETDDIWQLINMVFE